MDPLAEVLQTLLLRSMVLYQGCMTAPWGIQFGWSPPGEPQDASFHVVTQGRCLLEVEGTGAEPIPVQAGDLIVLPHGNRHSLRDLHGTPVRPLEAWHPEATTDRDGVTHFGGGDGAVTRMVCGTFYFQDGGSSPTAETLPNPLRAALPPMLIVRGDGGGQPATWLAGTLDLLLHEARNNAPGAQTVMSRLADVLFIQAVRAFLASECEAREGDGANWLRALADRQVGAAMAAIHRAPAAEWSVEALAGEAGLSRSAFAERFTRLVGEPPLRYVTRWRLYTATRLLRSGGPAVEGKRPAPGHPLAEVAAQVGYASEAAFSNAFRRWTGLAPGAYRRSNRAVNGGGADDTVRAAVPRA